MVPSGAVSFVLVDVNCDGTVNIVDADTVVQMLLKFDMGVLIVIGLLVE